MSTESVNRFELECTSCSFADVVVGEFPEVIEAAEAHRQEVHAGPTEHFVNVRRLSDASE